MNREMKEAILFEITILKMAITTYEKMINNYMVKAILPNGKRTKRIIELNKRIMDNEELINKFRHILLLGNSK